MSRRSKAFSLVELLTVIGVIAVIVSMLMPTLARARRQAEAVQCAAQLRALGQAFHMYAGQFDGNLPNWSGWHVPGGDGIGDDAPGPGWMEKLAPLFAQPLSAAYKCPAFPVEHPMNYFLSVRYAAVSGRENLKLAEIRRSSEFVLSGDCTQPNLYPAFFGISPHLLDDCDKDDATQEGIVFDDQNGGRNMHPGGNNVLFADDHVQIFPAFDPRSMTYHPSRVQSWSAVTPE